MEIVGYCQCGCGRRTEIATRSRTSRAHVKGQPLDFVRGHKKKREHWGDRPLPLCACGCGESVTLATRTHSQRGSIAGMPNLYIAGHSSRRADSFRPLCACGCGEKVLTRNSTVRRGHHMKLIVRGTRVENRGYTTPCHIWQGAIDERGYGRYEAQANGRRVAGTVLVHRQVWIAAKGDPGQGIDVHHLCEQKDCCNIEHLALRSRSEHLRAHRGISPEKYEQIVAALRTAQESQAGIARRFGVSKVFIWRLKKELGY